MWKLILFTVLFLPSLTLAALAEKPFDVHKQNDSTYILTGKDYGTNVGLVVGEKGIILIDPMPGEPYFQNLHSLIKDISNKPIAYVVNTHNHEDHTGGNEYFSKNGATIFDLTDLLPKSTPINGKLISSKNLGLEIIRVKSHTNLDNIFFHSESNTLFVGDVFDNSWHPTFYAGGLDGFTKAINTILALGDSNTLIVPGHGEPTNKEVVKAFHQNTLVWLKRVSKLHKEKASVEQIMADKKINEILQRFNTEKRNVFIPKKAFRRFIERTISIVSSNQS